MTDDLRVLGAAATAIPIGIAFGAILERVGLGDSRVIAAQFTGRNFAVVRVMFGAIVTAMLGVAWLGAAGFMNPSAIAVPPTDIAGQVVGGVIFGAGFAIASLCPGTACVAASSGTREGFAAVAGLLAGTLLTAWLWPLVDGVVGEGVREQAYLGSDLGIPAGAVILVITLMAVAAMMIARRFERESDRAWWHVRMPEAVALTLAGAFVLMQARPAAPSSSLAMIANEISREADHVDPLELAEWIKDGKRGLRVIDVREGLDSSTYMIPGARAFLLDSVPMMSVSAGDEVVLYSDGGTHAAQAWVLLRARGVHNVRVLKDGMAAWEDEVLRPAAPAALLDAAAQDSASRRFARARALSLWFGGRPRLGPASEPAAPGAPRARRRNTC